jgi:hypothetical protein
MPSYVDASALPPTQTLYRLRLSTAPCTIFCPAPKVWSNTLHICEFVHC